PRVVIARAPGVFGPWMAEYVIGWCAWITQRIETYREAQRQRRWLDHVLPDRLLGKTLTIVGLGDIGRAIARAARAFGMRVVGVSRSGRRVREAERVFKVGELARALADADFVVVLLPLTPETLGLIGADALAAMKPTAWLLNIARGAVVDEAALLEALEHRRIAGAILDVFATEPLPPHHRLWRTDNVVITPHIAGPSTPEEIAPVFNDNLARYHADPHRLLGPPEARRLVLIPERPGADAGAGAPSSSVLSARGSPRAAGRRPRRAGCCRRRCGSTAASCPRSAPPCAA